MPIACPNELKTSKDRSLLDVITNVLGDVFRFSPAFENSNERLIGQTGNAPANLHTIGFFIDRRLKKTDGDVHQFEI